MHLRLGSKMETWTCVDKKERKCGENNRARASQTKCRTNEAKREPFTDRYRLRRPIQLSENVRRSSGSSGFEAAETLELNNLMMEIK
ncbi:hypothetical protein GWI33_013712 [Rhynchophorus ferrugineus]|uniref:Uncharacterized protein n=1 Tax=Rhynchophorus ferrugineus TaxID=354439 RepID=A0A834I392_RHYFE|nr:hypothetical protein GWI33_013712 [Rhynchophorus ferrugineus]